MELHVVFTPERKRQGVVFPATPSGFYLKFFRDEKQKITAVQIFRDKEGFIVPCKTFRPGDAAEWGSYNLSYIGNILAITENSVTISHSRRSGHPNGSKHRLKLHDFCWRNYNFDEAKAEANNLVEMMNH